MLPIYTGIFSLVKRPKILTLPGRFGRTAECFLNANCSILEENKIQDSGETITEQRRGGGRLADFSRAQKQQASLGFHACRAGDFRAPQSRALRGAFSPAAPQPGAPARDARGHSEHQLVTLGDTRDTSLRHGGTLGTTGNGSSKPALTVLGER